MLITIGHLSHTKKINGPENLVTHVHCIEMFLVRFHQVGNISVCTFMRARKARQNDGKTFFKDPHKLNWIKIRISTDPQSGYYILAPLFVTIIPLACKILKLKQSNDVIPISIGIVIMKSLLVHCSFFPKMYSSSWNKISPEDDKNKK